MGYFSALEEHCISINTYMNGRLYHNRSYSLSIHQLLL